MSVTGRTTISKWFMPLAAAAALLAAPAAGQYRSEGSEFLGAVRDRDGTTVTQLLSQPGNTLINSRDITTGETALHIATKRRDTVWISFLADRGADPNIADENGVTPVQIAAQLGLVDAVEALVAAGADIDRSNDAGETPLIAAVHRRDVPIVRVLIANGANPGRTDNSGRSARDYARLIGADSRVLAELERADREAADAAATYGPR